MVPRTQAYSISANPAASPQRRRAAESRLESAAAIAEHDVGPGLSRSAPPSILPPSVGGTMRYSFLVDTYASERVKTLNVWSMFSDADLSVRPHPRLERDRTPGEHMVHQCMSEDKWFTTMFGIDVGAPPLPARETRLDFIRRYAEDSENRLA